MVIIDLRPFKQSANIESVDVAKRLMDYVFRTYNELSVLER